MAKLFVVSAPSGAGKSTLIRKALAAFPGLAYSVSATTRKPRPGEQNGREYHFLTPEAFRALRDSDGLAEWQEVYPGTFYGTPRRFLDEKLGQGVSVILDLDVFGKTNFDKIYPGAVGIFIDVPSLGALRERLLRRASDSPEAIEKRLRKAETEITHARTRGAYRYTVVNDDLARAEKEFLGIIRKEISQP